MSEPSQHHGSLELGQRLDAIHAHQQRAVAKWPWLILALLAVLAVWGLLRRHPAQQPTQAPPPAETTH